MTAARGPRVVRAVLVGEGDGARYVVERCPYCGRRHVHGAGDGHRVPHCLAPGDGYVLVGERPPGAPSPQLRTPAFHDLTEPGRYRAFRETLGDPKRAARVLGCRPSTVRARERGYRRITDAAALKLHDSVHAAALAEEERREARRLRAVERRAAREGMTTAEFHACLEALDWTQAAAARYLAGGDAVARRWVRGWASGRIVPKWVARDMRTALGLGAHDPWPSAAVKGQDGLEGDL